MEAAPIIICFVVVAVLVAVGVMNSMARERRELMAYVAQKYGGEVITGKWLTAPMCVFLYRGAPAVLTVDRPSRHQSLWTQLTVDWPDRETYCEVIPAPPFSLARFLAMGLVKTGDTTFDRTFCVRGNDPSRVRELLSGGVQSHLVQMWHWGSSKTIYVRIERGRMIIRKRMRPKNAKDAVEFTERALELYSQAVLSNMSGIEIVSERMAPLKDEATCQVCSEEIGGDIVYCRQCMTPHHHDCWLYNGLCAVYGCGELRYLAGRRAAKALNSIRVDH